MSRIPRIAVFKPDERESGTLHALFQRHEYSLRMVHSPSEMLDLIADEGESFDAAIIPLRLQDGSSGVTTSLQLKADESLASVPILGLSYSKDKAIIRAFYDAGADCVISAPFDADLMYFQINSLSRHKRLYDELVKQNFESSGLRHSTVDALNCAREALLLTDSQGTLFFANSSARLLLGLSNPPTSQQYAAASPQFGSMIRQHQEYEASLNPDDYRGEASPSAEQLRIYDFSASSFDYKVSRLDNQRFRAVVRITTLSGVGEQVCGYALSITDRSELEHLASMLMQGVRMRALGLMTLAGVLHEMRENQGSSLFSCAQIESLIKREHAPAELGSVMTLLLEILDVVISEGVGIKVSARQDLQLAMIPSDALQLLGGMLLHAVEHAGVDGVIMVTTQESRPDQPGNVARISMRSESRRVTPPQPEDYLSSLIQGEFVPPGTPPNQQQIPIPALIPFDEIAQRYGASINYRRVSDAVIVVETEIPIHVSHVRVQDDEDGNA